MININPLFGTTIVQKLALYCSSYDGNDIYYLKEAVILMVNLFGEEKLVEMLKKDESANKEVTRKIGENWFKPKGMHKNLQKISEILEKTNKAYSILSDKTLKKIDKDKVNYNIFLRQAKFVAKIENDFYALFVFLVQNSSIQQMNISPQFLKVLEQGKSFGGVNKEKIRHESNSI